MKYTDHDSAKVHKLFNISTIESAFAEMILYLLTSKLLTDIVDSADLLSYLQLHVPARLLRNNTYFNISTIHNDLCKHLSILAMRYPFIHFSD